MTKCKAARLRKGLTARELAEIIGVTREYISLLERRKRQPSFAVMLALSNALGVPMEKLMMEEASTEDGS
nr:helix-turn-helix transcriptional regulator [uncultured Anaeromusa sp.]